MIKIDNEIISKVLFTLSKNTLDTWTVDDATKGTSIMGGTGSGKTSASGKKIATTFLSQGWGGIVLCAKTDEVKLWRKYCKETGREKDLIVFEKAAKHTDGEIRGLEYIFNPIDYEMKRSGEGAGETQNLTNIFMNIYRMGNRISGEGDIREERYWDSALKRCLNRVIELIKLSKQDLTYENMVKILSTISSVDEAKFDDSLNCLNPKDYKTTEKAEIGIQNTISNLDQPNNYCLKCLVNAHYEIFETEKKGDKELVYAFNLVKGYFVYDLPAMDDKTKSIVNESFMGLAEPFLSGILFKHFSGTTNIRPECTYEQNKIIVLNFPIKEFLDAGIIAQSIFKLMFQQAVERRDVTKYPTPVFLWSDEAHYFINAYDQIFLTTARSSRTATVFLSQNISNYLSVMGSGAKSKVDSLMGNLCTKIFHANSDAETNEYASRLIGNTLSYLYSLSEQQNTFSLQQSQTQNMNSQYLPQVQPREFTTLKTGGPLNQFKVGAIITVSGREWADGKNFIRVSFNQNFNH